MKNVLLRRVLKTEKRPYPEPNTTVFKTDPRANKTVFCWALPHHSLFNQVLANPHRYAKDQINDIKAYQAEDLVHFGFQKIELLPDKKITYHPIPGFVDRPLGKSKKSNKSSLILF